MKRRDFLEDAGLAAACLLLGGCGGRTPPPLSSNRLNLLLVVSDALRADHLGSYGAPGSVTPNMDALAERGVAFTNAMSSSPATGPAHASLMTGTYPTRHGVMLNEGRMSEGLSTLAETLGRAGYDTAAVVSNPVLSRRTGLGVDRGFALFDDTMPRLEQNRAKPFRDAPASTAAALRWLRERRNRPFFLWVHLMEPHGPYEVPDPSCLQAVGDLAPRPGEPERLQVLATNRGPGGIPRYQVLGDERAPARYRARYAARAAYVDRYVGQIADALRDRGAGENTVTVFLSDHGELLGEGGYYFQHSVTLQRAVLRIPLVIDGPGIVEKGRVDEVVGITDVLPTLLELLEVRSDDVEAQVQGQSLAPLLRGRQAGVQEARFAFCQYGHECAAMLGKWKYTVGGEDRPAARLTDLKADRLDAPDLSAVQPRVAANLESRLRATLSEAPDLFVRGRGKPRQLTEEDRERLRALGYLQ